jgi:hypothetical protein
MTDSHPNEPSPANASPAYSPEHAPSGSKGCLGCLGMIVLLIVLGVMFLPSWHWARSLNPAQRAELSRLIGNFEGVSSSQDIFPSQWAIDWQVHFFLDDANRLKCECAPAYYQNNLRTHVIFTETVDVRYNDSGKPGYIRIARSGQDERWNIYIESSVLKSGNEITSLMLYDRDFGQCNLHRQ